MHIETLKSHQQFPMRTAYNSFKCSLMDLSRVYQTLKGILRETILKVRTRLSDDYCIRRLLKANIRNDVEGIVEVKGLMNEIRSAWNMVPELLEDPNISVAS